MKKLSLFLIFFLFLSFASAVPPLTTYFIGDSGFILDSSIMPYVKVGTSGELQVHVYNQSNGMLYSSPDAFCEGTLAYPNGTIMINQNATPEGDYFIFSWNNTMMNSINRYSYSFHCKDNTTENLGGYYTSEFIVTETGTATEEDNQQYYVIVIILIMIIAGLLYVGDKIEILPIEYKKKVANDKYELVKRFVDKYFIYLFAAWFTLPLINVSIKVNEVYALGLTNTLNGVYAAVMWSLRAVSLIALILILVYLFIKFNDYIMEKMK